MLTLNSCPVCYSQNIQLAYQGKTTRDPSDPKRWKVYKCLDCTLGFINPQPTWTELQPYYSSDYPLYQSSHGLEDTEDNLVEQAKAAGEYRGVKIKPGLRLLDVGCGGGSFLNIAKQLGAEVQGIEPSEYGFTSTRALGLPVFLGTLEDYFKSEARDRKFDLITSNHVIEHVPNPVEVLELMGKLLAPGGAIQIAVPNADCKFAQRLKDRWHSTDLPYHILQFTSQSFTCAAQKAGLQIRQQYTSSPDFAVANSIRLLMRYQWFIPRTLLSKISWIDNVYAPRLANQMDSRGEGEALVTELEAVN